MNKTPIGLKFCCSCNPEYEHIEYWEEIRSLAEDKIDWVNPEEFQCRALLLINGCQSACAEENLNPELKKYALISVKDRSLSPKELIGKILNLALEEA